MKVNNHLQPRRHWNIDIFEELGFGPMYLNIRQSPADSGIPKYATATGSDVAADFSLFLSSLLVGLEYNLLT